VSLFLAAIYPAAHASGLLVLTLVAAVLVALAATEQIRARTSDPLGS
jgi:hypothetical protein